MNSRIPRTFGPTDRRHHFRIHPGGGLCLNLPVHASLPEQASRIATDGGVELAAGEIKDTDHYLRQNEDGSVSIRA